MEFVQGLVVGQLEPRYGSKTESDWERAAMPAHAAPAALNHVLEEGAARYHFSLSETRRHLEEIAFPRAVGQPRH